MQKPACHGLGILWGGGRRGPRLAVFISSQEMGRALGEPREALEAEEACFKLSLHTCQERESLKVIAKEGGMVEQVLRSQGEKGGMEPPALFLIPLLTASVSTGSIPCSQLSEDSTYSLPFQAQPFLFQASLLFACECVFLQPVFPTLMKHSIPITRRPPSLA